ncbi:MAG TPA: pilus assembly protein N-terminal domain-containing protein [Chroococcales cyanobacterium]
MNKPQLCLAMSVSLTLMQASLLPAYSEPSSAIWQKLSGAGNSPAPKHAAKTPVQKTAPVRTAQPTISDAHAMLFLKGKQSALQGAAAPAAALTIHPAMSDSAADLVASNDVGESSPAIAGVTTAPSLTTPSADIASTLEAPMSATQSSASLNGTPAGDMPIVQNQMLSNSSQQMLAQLAPDQVVAQGADNSGNVTATPIPPVVTGTVDLEEFKTTNVIDLKVSQSRTFKLRNKIVRTSISDPGIAEPVVVSENQLVLLGKNPGTATLVLWDDAGNSVAIDLRVTRDYAQLQSTLREIDPRIIVKAFNVGGTDRVLLLGDVDHPDSVIRAFAAANVFMDDRGMNIQVANSRLINARLGEGGGVGGGGGGGGGQTGQLASLSSVDRYTFYPNLGNNLGKAQVITSDGGRVTSLVKVRKVPLIVLHVTFMEMNSTAARALGMQVGVNMSARTFGFGIGGTNSVLTGSSAAAASLTAVPGGPSGYNVVGLTSSIAPGTAPQPAQVIPSQSNPNVSSGNAYIPGASTTPVNFLASNVQSYINPLTGLATTTTTPIVGLGLGVLNTAPSLIQQAVLFGSPGGAAFSPAGLANLFTGTSNFGISDTTKWSVNPTINGIISHSRARVLSEPTLVTISGERASFLAGGEIPIIQSIATAGASQQSVTFEPFGLRINMIPVLMENGSLNLEISPEERIPSFQFGLNVPGSSTVIPGFTTRKAQTIVEMKPGQELFIAGLITANSGRELTKTPIIGEVPVLGALYRSKAFSKNESELVVAIRPEIILPGTPGQLKLPEEIGRVEGPRDTNLFQVEPTVVDERHYTSGRDERHQKTSPTLPEGSPIPDNE